MKFKPWWLLCSGILAAIGASGCCLLPFLALSAGIGGAWLGALTSIGSSAHLVLLAVSLVSLGWALYFSWRPIRCRPDAACARPDVKNRQRTLVTLVSLLVVLWLLLPALLASFIS